MAASETHWSQGQANVSPGPLFDQAVFSGVDYDESRDKDRLTGQIKRIYDLMRDGKWRTLKQIEDATGDPPASISGQLRNLRKSSFGSHTVDRKYLGDGLYAYRIGGDIDNEKEDRNKG
jgi:hypothetical protein